VVTVTLKNGDDYSKRIEKLSGWIGFPLTREQRLKKFHSCAARVLSKGAAEHVAELIEKLEQLSDIREVMDLVRADPG
jgi:hypothetical protein